MKIQFGIIGLLALSCNSKNSVKEQTVAQTENTVAPPTVKVIDTVPEIIDVPVTDTADIPEVINTEINIDTLTIRFKGFNFHLYDHQCYPLDDVDSVTSDTINLEEDIGSSIASKKFRISTSDTLKLSFEVFTSYSQTLRVYVGEKDFEDLDEWTTSDPFVQLEHNKGIYTLPPFNDDVKTKEISEDLNQIIRRIKSIEGIDTTQISDSIVELNQLPLEFWVYRTIIKIKVTDEDGNESTKYIINNSSWGC